MSLIEIKNLTRVFDVSKPLLNRVVERLPPEGLSQPSPRRRLPGRA